VVKRHGGKRIALGHGEQFRIHLGEPPNANCLVIHEFPSLEAVEAAMRTEAAVQG
jgi:hypothetical protein